MEGCNRSLSEVQWLKLSLLRCWEWCGQVVTLVCMRTVLYNSWASSSCSWLHCDSRQPDYLKWTMSFVNSASVLVGGWKHEDLHKTPVCLEIKGPNFANTCADDFLKYGRSLIAFYVYKLHYQGKTALKMLKGQIYFINSLISLVEWKIGKSKSYHYYHYGAHFCIFFFADKKELVSCVFICKYIFEPYKKQGRRSLFCYTICLSVKSIHLKHKLKFNASETCKITTKIKDLVL